MKKRAVGIIVIAVMAVSMLGCSKQEPVNSGSETHSEQSAAESVMADGNEGKADGLVAGSEEYNEEKVADLGNIQYAKIVFDNSAYSYPKPNVPLAGIIGLSNVIPQSFTLVSIIVTPFHRRLDHVYKLV